MDHERASCQLASSPVTVSQDECKDSRYEAAAINRNHREADRRAVVKTDASHCQGDTLFINVESGRTDRCRFEVVPRLTVVIFDVSALSSIVLARVVMEVSMMLMLMLILEVAIAVPTLACGRGEHFGGRRGRIVGISVCFGSARHEHTAIRE